jgi:hypothetical protein
MHECASRILAQLPVAAAVVVFAVVPGAAAADQGVRGPWLLTALPGTGTVTWRCDPAREARGVPALALGVRTSTATATETVTLRIASKAIVRRVMQPGQRLELPYRRSSHLQLSIVQATEPGTLKALISVDFSPRLSPSHCFAHLPPGLVVHLYPR